MEKLYTMAGAAELDVSRRVSVSRHVSRHVFECLGLAMPMPGLSLGFGP